MCLFCIMNSVTRTSQHSVKSGESQVFGNTGGTVSYSFATQNFPNQFGVFDSFISELPFQGDYCLFASWENVADIRFVSVPDSEELISVLVGVTLMVKLGFWAKQLSRHLGL